MSSLQSVDDDNFLQYSLIFRTETQRNFLLDNSQCIIVFT